VKKAKDAPATTGAFLCSHAQATGVKPLAEVEEIDQEDAGEAENDRRVTSLSRNSLKLEYLDGKSPAF